MSIAVLVLEVFVFFMLDSAIVEGEEVTLEVVHLTLMCNVSLKPVKEIVEA